MNATVDDLGRIHFPAVWRLVTNDGYWFPNYQLPKEIIFDPSLPEDSQFRINDILPHKDPNKDVDEHYQPWDSQPPWGVEDFVQDPDTGQWFIDMYLSWEFPYWQLEPIENNQVCLHTKFGFA